MNKECKDHLGNVYNSISDMCKCYGVSLSLFWARVNNMGWSVERALTTPKRNDTCKDHLNNTYNNLSEMCNKYKISKKCFLGRIEDGWSLENALTKPSGSRNPDAIGSRAKKVIDHKGTVYPSYKKMCEAYNLPYNVVYRRLQSGWSLEEALTTTILNNSVTDYLGNSFDSVAKMCEYHGVGRTFYDKRIKAGYSQKDALNPNHKMKRKHTTLSSKNELILQFRKDDGYYHDHKGNKFLSFRALCAHWNMKYPTVMQRLENGYNLVDALTKEKTVPIVTKSELQKYNIKYATVCRRMHEGMSKEEALTKPLDLGNHNNCKKRPVTIKGITYLSISEACRQLKMSQSYISMRLKYGFTVEEAFTIPKHMYIGEYRVSECLKRLNVTFYYDCSLKKIFEDFNINVDWNTFLSELKNRLEISGIKWSKSKIEKLRPDFTLYTSDDNKIIGVIEFDGEQHQNFVEYFFKTIEQFLWRSNTDFVKQDLWEYLNIPMLRVRHDQVNMIDDMVKDLLNNPNKYLTNHNTYLSEDEYWEPLRETKEKLDMAFAV